MINFFRTLDLMTYSNIFKSDYPYLLIDETMLRLLGATIIILVHEFTIDPHPIMNRYANGNKEFSNVLTFTHDTNPHI